LFGGGPARGLCAVSLPMISRTYNASRSPPYQQSHGFPPTPPRRPRISRPSPPHPSRPAVPSSCGPPHGAAKRSWGGPHAPRRTPGEGSTGHVRDHSAAGPHLAADHSPAPRASLGPSHSEAGKGTEHRAASPGMGRKRGGSRVGAASPCPGAGFGGAQPPKVKASGSELRKRGSKGAQPLWSHHLVPLALPLPHSPLTFQLDEVRPQAEQRERPHARRRVRVHRRQERARRRPRRAPEGIED